MTRFTIAMCMGWFGLAGIVAAQSPNNGGDGKSPPVKTVAAPPVRGVESVPPAPAPIVSLSPVLPPTSPGEAQTSREARVRELHLLQAQAESIHRAAVARAEQRTRRLESQRWYGISNTRPTANIDPYDGDYSAVWTSNYPFYPFRWVGSGEPWGYSEGP